MECESNRLQHAVQDSDYEAVDPWEDDRREAMKQLYSNKYPKENLKSVPSSLVKKKAFHEPLQLRRHPSLFYRLISFLCVQLKLFKPRRPITSMVFFFCAYMWIFLNFQTKYHWTLFNRNLVRTSRCAHPFTIFVQIIRSAHRAFWTISRGSANITNLILFILQQFNVN